MGRFYFLLLSNDQKLILDLNNNKCYTLQYVRICLIKFKLFSRVEFDWIYIIYQLHFYF